MLKGGSRVLVGFSGGADSTLLLTLLSQTEGITVGAAHLNHGIRGDEADRDEKFCKDLCARLNVPFYLKRVCIPEIAENTSTTVEEAARNERYSFFNDVCSSHGYDLIATAHNADDVIETVIFRLARGSSLDGLCGIPPVRDNIIRPLIEMSKEEVVSALASEDITYVTDSTNFETVYVRNKIRHQVLPILKELNPSLCDVVSSCAESLRRDRDLLRELADGHSFNDGRGTLSSLHDALLSRVITKELEVFGECENKHVSLVIDAIRSDKAHISLSLHGCTLICDRDLIYVKSNAIDTVCDQVIPLKQGINDIGGDRVIYVGNDSNEINTLKNIYKLSTQVSVCSDKIYSNCFIRARRDGDTYILNGMTKKVKKMIQSLKLPSSYTDKIPFICNEDGIIYIPHFPISDIARAKDGSKTEIYYFYRKEQL